VAGLWQAALSGGEGMVEKPLYTISVVADLIGVGQATLREWERQGLVRPARRNGLRLYSDNDLRRLRFIQQLLEKGLNLAGVGYIISGYPCWFFDTCPRCTQKTEPSHCARVCWKEDGTFCISALDNGEVCQSCEYNPARRSSSGAVTSGKASERDQSCSC